MARILAAYSDPIERAPVTLRRLIERDPRIVAFTIEPGGCFIYTDAEQWCHDEGNGTFRGDTVAAAIRFFKSEVRPAPKG